MPLPLDGGGGKPFAPSILPSSARSARSPKVTLGEPGLSFRYVQTFGVTESAYPAPDNYHLNSPGGLFIDGSNNVYVAESRGYRVLKYNSSGTNTLAIGTAGLCVDGNNPTRFCTPNDIAMDSGGNFWIATGSRVVQFDSSGTYQRQLPVPDSSGNWSSGTGNTQFNGAQGIAFDNSAGRMFVADVNNHRVQVYNYSGSGSPTYSATIGVTGVSGSDNSHFNYPYRLAVDSSGRLYVVDNSNHRIQRCTLSGTWTCATFVGTGLTYPEGIALDSGGNVYIANSGGSPRILKCDPAGTCNDFIPGYGWYTQDLAVDSSGNVYVATHSRAVIRKYNSSGVFVGTFAGTFEVPYFADSSRINSPWGIVVASNGSVFVSERYGNRLLKYNAAGVQQWAFGTAGVGGSDNTRLSTLEGKPALAANGNIYVPDTGNNRIQIFDAASSAYVGTFGSYGTSGNDKFSCPNGIAISPVNGDFYVVDRCNHRVQVYDSTLSLAGYKATLGETGVIGSDGTHFSWPRDVAVDASGNIYVADNSNQRIQKCTLSGSSGTCTTFAGETGVRGNDFDHLHNPRGVTVDSAGRVYVADQSNNRIQVFDSSGAYLTSIGQSSGNRTGQLRNPSGVALDSAGNLYVADRENHRIQKYVIGVPGWLQSNINGFGDRLNYSAGSLAVFNGQLYAGTHNNNVTGAQLWRTGSPWTSVMTNGFGDPSNYTIVHMAEFNGNLYASTSAWDYVNNLSLGARVYRSSNGTTWSSITTGIDSSNSTITRFAVFNNKIYASTGSGTTAHGAEIWRSDTGDSSTWSQVVANGDGNAQNSGIPSMQVFNGYLYAGVNNLNTAVTPNTSTGGQVWRTNDGTTWTTVTTNGFGNTDNFAARSFAVFNGSLYVGVTSYNFATWTSTGGKIFRCATCDGSDWSSVVTDGFGDTNNQNINGMIAFDNALYAVTTNSRTGMEVWRTTNGTTWVQVNPDGFGNSNNTATYYNNNTVVFNNALYIGASNSANGGQVWQLQPQLFLPLILR